MLKQKLWRTTAIAILSITIVLVTATTAFAAESYKGTITVTTSWKTLATSTTGFNKNVAVSYLGAATDGLGILKADIRMLGKSGNVLWTEYKVCATGTNVFWCGPDVYTIQISQAYGNGTASARAG